MAPKCTTCGHHDEMPSNLPPRSQRMSELLSSNACPLQVEEASFRAELPVRHSRIARLEEEISAAQAKLHSLVRRRRMEHRDLNDIQTVLHPIRRLPPDILNEIFAICLDEQDPRADSLDTNGMPWVLVQVCGTWRAAGIRASRLWSRVHVSFDTLALHPHPERLVHVLWLQISRSKQCSLEVELSSYTHVSEMHPILPVLWGTSNRWRTLSLDMTDTSNRNILAPTFGALDALEYVAIKSAPSHHTPAEDTDFDVFSDPTSAPRLKSMQVTNAVSIGMPWSRLEEFVLHPESRRWGDLSRGRVATTLDILKKLSTARTFKTELVTFAVPAPSPHSRLRHQYLHTLWIDTSVDGNDLGIQEFMNAVELPALQSLGWIRGVDVKATQSLVRRSNCTLTTLAVKLETYTPKMRDLLRDSCEVDTLVLKDDIDPTYFSTLGAVPLGLAVLDMSEANLASVSEDKVWRLVNGRKLKEVRLPSGFTWNAARWVSSMNEGCIVSIG
ncbi:hypothetical protein CYLTODRAFT_417055 [Cylindrobasidium torrendii FP15055 ss-10]|uniref:F-box domain-containing protein n=1 Tax=Cylindrobasidium torrendii FP15055 ss-10 TaxID=1314674 RepID=A0A0D7BT70_9AGAR|nr:hypothetical protein CYLTODRAFT_417055 [Cylindrobasidium torrendii FP15055 ss-10]